MYLKIQELLRIELLPRIEIKIFMMEKEKMDLEALSMMVGGKLLLKKFLIFIN